MEPGALFSRRRVLISGCVLATYPFFSASAQVQAIGAAAALKSLADVLGAAADGMSKLADSIAHITILGVRGYDEASARHIRARLTDIAARLVHVHKGYNEGIISGLEGYIERVQEANEQGKQIQNLERLWWRDFLSY
jgi:hypothetical protein